MSRVEENKEFIDRLAVNALEHGVGPFEEAAAWQMGATNAILGDISKSLAVIADAKAKEAEKWRY